MKSINRKIFSYIRPVNNGCTDGFEDIFGNNKKFQCFIMVVRKLFYNQIWDSNNVKLIIKIIENEKN